MKSLSHKLKHQADMFAIGAYNGKIVYQMAHMAIASMALRTVPEVLEDFELKDVFLGPVAHSTEDFHGVVLGPVHLSAACYYLSWSRGDDV